MPDPAQAIRTWCTSHKISNLEVLEGTVSGQDLQIITCMGQENPAALRTLLARLFEAFIWLDAPRILVYPVVSWDRMICVVKLWYCPPELTLNSGRSRTIIETARQSKASAQTVHKDLVDTLVGDVEAFCDSMPEDTDAIQDRIRTYVSPCAYSSDEALVLQFISNLSQPIRAVIEDLRVLVHLDNRQRESLEALDIWHHRERTSIDGVPQGVCARMSQLGAIPYERTRLNVAPIKIEELEDIPETTAEDWTEPTRQVTPQDLVTLICDTTAPKYRRNEALTQLQDLPHSPKLETLVLRAIGGSLDLNSARLLPFQESAGRLVEEIVFAEDCAQVTVALIGLAELDRTCPESLSETRDQRLAASASNKQRDRVLGESYQETVLTWLQDISPEFIRRLCTETANESRRPGWLASALQTLDRLQIPETKHLARLLESHRDSYLADWAKMLRKEQERRDRQSEQLADFQTESEVVGDSSFRTFHMRLDLWRQPGYAWKRYLESGHRNPNWDDHVEAAFAAYSFETGPQALSVGSDLQAAIDAGCEDGMVYYRRAVSVIDINPDAGYRWMTAAIPRLNRYPQNPYAVSAAENLGRWHRAAGRLPEARAFMQSVIDSDQAPMSAEHQLQCIDDEDTVQAAFCQLGPQASPLNCGDLQAHPSTTHSGTVTSLQVSPCGKFVASSDDRGYVQISLIERGDFGRVIPIDGRCVHTVGSSLCAWLSEDRLITAGTDGTVNAIPVVDGRIQAPEPITWSAGGITALHAENGAFLLGTEEGWVELRTATDDHPTRLIGIGSAPIVSLRTHGPWILARDQNSNMDLWKRDDLEHPAWSWKHEGYPLVFAELMDTNRLIFANDQGACWCVDLVSGNVVPMMQFTSSPPPAFARYHAESHSAFYGSRNGSMHIDRRPPAARTIITHNSLAMVDVSFEHGLIAHVDAAGTLAVNCFTPIHP